MGLRLNLVWEKPQDGEGRIPGYWEESSAGTGIALTTAATGNSPLVQSTRKYAQIQTHSLGIQEFIVQKNSFLRYFYSE